jgi:hypothetical protein
MLVIDIMSRNNYCFYEPYKSHFIAIQSRFFLIYYVVNKVGLDIINFKNLKNIEEVTEIAKQHFVCLDIENYSLCRLSTMVFVII